MKRMSKTRLIEEVQSLRSELHALRQTEESFRKIKETLSIVYDAIDSTVGGVAITDPTGRIMYVNSSFLRMFEYADHKEIEGINAADLFPGKEIQVFNDVRTITGSTTSRTDEFTVQRRDGTCFFVEVSSSVVKDSSGQAVGLMASFVDISGRKQTELERDQLIRKLQDALANIKILKGLLPICASCKKIRDDQGYWHNVDSYIHTYGGIDFTHSLCPECASRLYPDLFAKDDETRKDGGRDG